MTGQLLPAAAELQERGEPFALATVVRCEAPTSAKPGAKALIRQDGTVSGWIGGACAEPVVVREALEALRDGRPRLIALVGDGRPRAERTEGMLEYPMTCHSGGTLEIYVEPYLPKPLLVLVGHGPVIETLAALGRTAEYSVVALSADAVKDGLAQRALTPRAAVVVATHAASDEEALMQVLATAAGYVSLVASRRRAAMILDSLTRRGVPPEHLSRLKAPAGLDIGAVAPQEIAVSILAEIIHHQRSEKRPDAPADSSSVTEATDPVCGMLVVIATARHRSEMSGRVVYFCCGRCQELFERDPQRYADAQRDA